ncbi:MAG: DUF962 domain-containing protein [Pseudomonadota bacterium]|nr:DUF962 domain-containing protein [Pseudomonadota bacterium]
MPPTASSKSGPAPAPGSGQGSYDRFWLAYLRAHSRRRTRLIHYCGISLMLVGLAAGLWLGDWRIIAGGLALGYVTAWAAHLAVQGNVPVMFEGPKSAIWSAASGLRMYVLGLTMQLDPHLRRAGIKDNASS